MIDCWWEARLEASTMVRILTFPIVPNGTEWEVLLDSVAVGLLIASCISSHVAFSDRESAKTETYENLDITHNSGPEIVNRYLTERAKELYLKPGYRLRIIK